MKNSILTPNLRTNTQGDILIKPGGAIRAVGIRGDKGIVEGILCRFTDADDTDAYDTFFDAQTNFRFTEGMRCPIYFDHAMNALLGVKSLGEGVLRLEEEGIAIREGELDITDPDIKAIYDQVAAGELGWSSGTAGHLVEYTQVKSYAVHGESAWHIDHWPLGLDASLTPYPAEPRNMATFRSIRSRLTEPEEGAEEAARRAAIRLRSVRLKASLLA